MSLKKRIISLASALVCAISFGAASLIANAEVYIDELFQYKTFDEDGDGICDYVGIAGCEQSVKNLVIPEEFSGLPVKVILRYAFSNCSDIESIDIPNSVTSIEERAFNECSSLKA